jgi:hypothetical protein
VKQQDTPAPPTPAWLRPASASIPPPPTIAMETTIAPGQAAAPVEQIGIFVALWRFFFGGAGTAPQPRSAATCSARRPPSQDGRRDRHEGRHGATAIATGMVVISDRARDRPGRHEHKDKASASGDGRRDGRDGRRATREAARTFATPHALKASTARGHAQQRAAVAVSATAAQQQQPQQPQQQSAAPKPEAAAPRSLPRPGATSAAIVEIRGAWRAPRSSRTSARRRRPRSQRRRRRRCRRRQQHGGAC